MFFPTKMTAQGALCHPLLPSTGYSPCQAFKSTPFRARAFFNSGSRLLSRSNYKQQRKARSDSIVRNGLFDFLTPGGPSGASDELVSEILEAARSTNGGSKASTQTKEQIEELVWSALLIAARDILCVTI